MPLQVWAPLTLPPVTADPSDAEEGSLWYRKDSDQVVVADGQPGKLIIVGPTGNLPIIRSGLWHAVPAYGPPATITPTNNRAYALPLWTGRTAQITGIAAEVTVLGAGALRAGLYTSHPSSSIPNTLVQDFGTVDTGTAGVKQWISLSQFVRPVLYWLVVVQQGLITVGLRARDTSDPIVSMGNPVLSANRNAYFADGISGALPATFPTIAGSTQGPSAMVQLN